MWQNICRAEWKECNSVKKTHLFEQSEFCIFSYHFLGMRELDSGQARSRGASFFVLFLDRKRTDKLNKKLLG